MVPLYRTCTSRLSYDMAVSFSLTCHRTYQYATREGGFLFEVKSNLTSYSLNFRCYDMSAIDPGSGPVPHLVDTQSDDFRVYSPRK